MREHRPDVAVMDLEMPVLDGVAATRAIVAGQTGTQVLVLTTTPGSTPPSRRARWATCSRTPSPTPCWTASVPSRGASRRSTPAPPGDCSCAPPDRGVGPAEAAALSPREAEVLRLVVEGLLNKQIAARLGITERTVTAHLTSAYQRVGVADRTQAALWVQRHDLDDV